MEAGCTALHYAAWHGHEKIVEILITKSPKLIDTVTTDNWTVLDYAAQGGRIT